MKKEGKTRKIIGGIWSANITPADIRRTDDDIPETVEVHAGENVYKFAINGMGITKDGDLEIRFGENARLVIERGKI